MEFGVLRKQPVPGISIRKYFYPNMYPFFFSLMEKGFYIKVKQENGRQPFFCFFVSAGHDGLFHLM